METDACGNVYLADDWSDAVWRFGPGGGEPVRVAEVGGGHVTGMTWLALGDAADHRLVLAIDGGSEVSESASSVAGRRLFGGGSDEVSPSWDDVPPAVDCRDVPSHATRVTELEKVVGFHDVAFDPYGFMIGWDEFNLVAIDAAGRVQLVAPEVGPVDGLDWLSDESLVAATLSGVTRIYPSGAKEIIAPDVFAYGVTTGPDGLVYAADNARAYRIDADGKSVAVYLDPAAYFQSWGPRVVAFDADASVAYFASAGEAVWVVTLDEHFDPVGAPRRLATVSPGVRFLDGLAVDACGNLFVPNYETKALYRLRADGRRELYHQWGLAAYGHGLEWGAGLGGWRTDALYLPQPYDAHSVQEMVIGVPSARSLPWGEVRGR